MSTTSTPNKSKDAGCGTSTVHYHNEPSVSSFYDQENHMIDEDEEDDTLSLTENPETAIAHHLNSSKGKRGWRAKVNVSLKK